MIANDSIVFHGDPVMYLFDHNPGLDLTVHWRTTYKTSQSESLAILVLSIRRIDDAIVINDKYLPHLPDLKAIPIFRKYIVQYLTSFAVCQNDPLISAGIQVYCNQIGAYSDIEVLVKQAKRSVAALDITDNTHPKKVVATARAILAAVGETPGCDVQMRHEPSWLP